jgi:homoserine kinase
MRRRIRVPASVGNLGPGFDTLGLALGHPDLLGVCLSGAGPSILAVVRRDPRPVGRALADLYENEGIACTVRLNRVHQ